MSVFGLDLGRALATADRGVDTVLALATSDQPLAESPAWQRTEEALEDDQQAMIESASAQQQAPPDAPGPFRAPGAVGQGFALSSGDEPMREGPALERAVASLEDHSQPDVEAL